MKNEFIKEDINSLLKEIKSLEHDIKKMIWSEYYSETEPMPDSFPWKRTIREKLGIVI